MIVRALAGCIWLAAISGCSDFTEVPDSLSPTGTALYRDSEKDACDSQSTPPGRRLNACAYMARNLEHFLKDGIKYGFEQCQLAVRLNESVNSNCALIYRYWTKETAYSTAQYRFLANLAYGRFLVHDSTEKVLTDPPFEVSLLYPVNGASERMVILAASKSDQPDPAFIRPKAKFVCETYGYDELCKLAEKYGAAIDQSRASQAYRATLARAEEENRAFNRELRTGQREQAQRDAEENRAMLGAVVSGLSQGLAPMTPPAAPVAAPRPVASGGSVNPAALAGQCSNECAPLKQQAAGGSMRASYEAAACTCACFYRGTPASNPNRPGMKQCAIDNSREARKYGSTSPVFVGN